jgi:demethylmenaquinone methyltransferase / 2-methoxy-6-polyprenyl-1,4-benzoquinol methylase
VVVEKKKDSVKKMFDDISPKYDFLNHFLSFGIDITWRRKLVGMLGELKPVDVLDVATGTGDLAVAIAGIAKGKIVGIDISAGMLEIARAKVERKGLNKLVTFRQGDAEKIPFSDNSFDAVTVAFGVRNYENLEKGLSEMRRVLRAGGTMMILEFSSPRAAPFKQLYRFYSKYMIPFFGRLVSKHSNAYTYLPESVAAFPSGKDFLAILEHSGMKNCRVRQLSFGIASIYCAEK